MISVESFSELLAVLYSAPLQPERWERFLNLLCDHTMSRSSFLLCADSRAGLSIRSQGGLPFPETSLNAYAARYAKTDPFLLPLVRSGRTGVIDCEELLPREELMQSDQYRYLNEPSGVRYPALVALTLTVRRFEAISFWRTEDEGYMDAESTRLLELLVPHIQSAMEIRQALGTADARATGAEAMADASATPTFLLGHDDEVLHANSAARELLDEADGLLAKDGVLSAAQPAMRKPLRALLDRARAAAKPLSLERTSGRRPLHLLASPVQGYGRGGVLLLATDPEKPVVLRDDVLREHFKFTGAETEVANGLLTGYPLEAIAALRKVKIGTVRDQVKSMLAKTGTGKQAEMIRLLLTLPRMT